jgi:uncharacterized protein DUF6411
MAQFEGLQSGHEAEVIIGAIIAACVILFVLALLAPRLSIWPQKGVDRTLGAGAHASGKAPGIVGRLLGKSFNTSRKATNKSAGAGRRTRSKLPL